jgi:hypothetical protein
VDTADVEDLARRSGFVDLEEMRALLLRLRLKLPNERSAYERWASQDGTKAGLLRLIEGSDSLGVRDPQPGVEEERLAAARPSRP